MEGSGVSSRLRQACLDLTEPGKEEIWDEYRRRSAGILGALYPYTDLDSTWCGACFAFRGWYCFVVLACTCKCHFAMSRRAWAPFNCVVVALCTAPTSSSSAGEAGEEDRVKLWEAVFANFSELCRELTKELAVELVNFGEVRLAIY